MPLMHYQAFISDFIPQLCCKWLLVYYVALLFTTEVSLLEIVSKCFENCQIF